MYMTSLTAYQKSKLSIAETLAVGTESEAPALGLGHRLKCAKAESTGLVGTAWRRPVNRENNKAPPSGRGG